MENSRQFNNTNIEIFPIGLGAMPLSLNGRPDPTQAHAVIEAFIHAGGNFIDTANVYCMDESEVGHNERLIEKTLSKLNQKNNIHVATKGGIKRNENNWIANAKPAFLRQSCEQSLIDLNTESIFLYQLHSPDPEIPLAESVGELLNLKNEGKIQYIGLSNVNLEQVQIALSITQIISVQNRCSLFDQRSFNDGTVEFCEKSNITFIAHSPVGGHFQHKQLTDNDSLKVLADKHNASPYQILIAWLLNKSASILPIPGASKVASIQDSLQANTIELDKDDIYLLNRF
ncbi:MAG: aldo/keto reductase [Proteobacteria bacterium]|nr:aldo/keto reductase [Pseudomonadota bacterium]NOG61172.1 aldo/keto reductase [Pseudomonadota bacterium]